jgi:hypothetical protein
MRCVDGKQGSKEEISEQQAQAYDKGEAGTQGAQACRQKEQVA